MQARDFSRASSRINDESAKGMAAKRRRRVCIWEIRAYNDRERYKSRVERINIHAVDRVAISRA